MGNATSLFINETDAIYTHPVWQMATVYKIESMIALSRFFITDRLSRVCRLRQPNLPTSRKVTLMYCFVCVRVCVWFGLTDAFDPYFVTEKKFENKNIF